MPTPVPSGNFAQPPRSHEVAKKRFGARLARLFFGAGLAAVGLLVGLVVPRLSPQVLPSRPAPEPAASVPLAAARQDDESDPDPGPQDHVWVIPTLPPAAEEGKRPPVPTEIDAGPRESDTGPKEIDTGRKDSPPVPPPSPEACKADRAFEQRLAASEEDLRRQLRAVAEVRLLSDAEVQRIRTAQQAAKDAVPGSRAQLRAAERNLQAGQAELQAAQRSGMTRLAYEEVCRRYKEIARTYQAVVRDYRPDNLEVARQEEQMDRKFNLRLHQALVQAAVRAGFGLESGPDCQLGPTAAAQMAELSKDLRRRRFVTIPETPVAALANGSGIRSHKRRGTQLAGNGGAVSESDGDVALSKARALQRWCDHHHLESKVGTAPTLTQMLQVENEATRLLLVRELTRIDSEEATTDLAVRAIADLSPAVRQAAVEGLQGRPWRDYGPVLLRGLRYPWPPVADHAAVALRALGPQEGVAPLVDMLDLPSPSRPYLDAATHRYAVREVVRINHLRSCLLCHAPSANKDDGLVRGFVPTPGEPLPSAYYEASGGNFIRADITYLRQDFSVTLPERDPGPWPRNQRYDFLTRVRQYLTPEEAVQLSAPRPQYPQREAVLYALRGLTGKDGGASSAGWRELLGPGVNKPEGTPPTPTPENIAVSPAVPKRPIDPR